MPAEYLFNSYFTAASLNAFLGRFGRSQRWLEKALQYAPHDPTALQMKKDLATILAQFPLAPALPWSELELLKQLAEKQDQPTARVK